jgi:hypothetical protein
MVAAKSSRMNTPIFKYPEALIDFISFFLMAAWYIGQWG